MDCSIAYFINSFFNNIDDRAWENVKSQLAHHVFLNYESMDGRSPSYRTNEEVIYYWQAFLPGFDITHHQISNFVFQRKAEVINALLYSTTKYYTQMPDGNSVEVLVGKYEIDIKQNADDLKIIGLKYNLQFREGNSSLEQLAINSMIDRNKGKIN